VNDRTSGRKPGAAGPDALTVAAAAPKRSYVRWVWAVAALVLLIRLAVVPLIATPWIMADEVVYASSAYQISHEFEFSARLKAVQPYPPGYSLVLVPATFLGNGRAIYWGMLATNCLLASLVGVLAFYLGRRFLPERDAFFASAVIAVLPSVSVYPYVIMSENLFVVLVMASCLLVVRAREAASPLAWAWVGVCVGWMMLTRAVGLMAVPAALVVVLLEWVRRRRWLYGMAALGAVLAGLALIQGSWLFIKARQAAGLSNVTGYQEETYLANLKQFLTEWPIFTTCMRLGLHQWLGVALAAGGVFLLFALDLLIRPSRRVPPALKTVGVYFVLFAGGITLACMMHMWRGFLWRQDWEYALIMRYMDPLVPVVVLCGMAGLVRLRAGRAGRLARVRLAVLSAAGVAIFLVAFPLDGRKAGDQLKFPNTMSVWYVQPMREFLDPTEAPPTATASASATDRHRSLGNWLGLPASVDVRRIVIVLAAGVFIAPFLLRRRFLGGRHALWTAGFLVLMNVPLILQQVRVSREADTMNVIPKWLCDHASPGQRVYFDEGDYYRSGKGMYLFYATCFWSPDLEITRYRREVAALSPHYVISWDRLPFPVEVETGPADARRYLYRTPGRGAARTILEDPRYFDVARLPRGSIEDAWDLEEGRWVWTKRETRFRFRYRLPDGPWVLALSGGGPRPRYDPAKLRVLLDGRLLRLPSETNPDLSHTKSPGDAVWRFPVPAGAAADGDDHVLTIQTNTFVPARALTDNPDDRELGIQVFWFKIEQQ